MFKVYFICFLGFKLVPYTQVIISSCSPQSQGRETSFLSQVKVEIWFASNHMTPGAGSLRNKHIKCCETPDEITKEGNSEVFAFCIYTTQKCSQLTRTPKKEPIGGREVQQSHGKRERASILPTTERKQNFPGIPLEDTRTTWLHRIEFVKVRTCKGVMGQILYHLALHVAILTLWYYNGGPT